jgi:hypothetical protein
MARGFPLSKKHEIALIIKFADARAFPSRLELRPKGIAPGNGKDDG